MTSFEIDRLLEPGTYATGIDEVGRGCLAGPVVVAAVGWRCDEAAAQPWFSLLADSKQIDAQRRAELLPHILAQADYVRVATLSHMVIDLINILRATLHGFELVAPVFQQDRPLFVDGNQRPVTLPYARTLVKGDSRMSAIAAASVVAKVTRDAMMVRLGRAQPEYGYEQHMGYATARHRKAIAECGPGLHHRKCFAPISKMCSEENEQDHIWLARIQSKQRPAELWEAFCHAYPQLSLDGARRALRAFHQRGLKLLPAPPQQP